MTERAKISSEHRAKRNQLAPDQSSTGNKKRNTKRWCKGKRGVEHQYEPFTKHYNLGWAKFNFKYLKCAKCGREEWK